MNTLKKGFQLFLNVCISCSIVLIFIDVVSTLFAKELVEAEDYLLIIPCSLIATVVIFLIKKH